METRSAEERPATPVQSLQVSSLLALLRVSEQSEARGALCRGYSLVTSRFEGGLTLTTRLVEADAEDLPGCVALAPEIIFGVLIEAEEGRRVSFLGDWVQYIEELWEMSFDWLDYFEISMEILRRASEDAKYRKKVCRTLVEIASRDDFRRDFESSNSVGSLGSARRRPARHPVRRRVYIQKRPGDLASW